MILKNTKKTLLIFLGSLCVILAAIGIFLPVLPTTPLLLLAAYFYARSSPRFYRWLVTNRWFGEYLRNYREGKGITLKNKIIVGLVLWLLISHTALVVVSQLWLKLLLFGIAVAVTVHLMMIKTFQPEKYPSTVLGSSDPDGKET